MKRRWAGGGEAQTASSFGTGTAGKRYEIGFYIGRSEGLKAVGKAGGVIVARPESERNSDRKRSFVGLRKEALQGFQGDLSGRWGVLKRQGLSRLP